ncbi:MAG: HAMP domain-containing histidine kinase [Emcibacter sp.]|nr:HAMP domain-containing histidine kinase [Emcibacter sp.]
MNIFRTSFARLTLVYMAVITVVGTGILYWSYDAFLEQSRDNINHLVDTDMAGMVSRYYDSGDMELARHISSALELTSLDNPRQVYLFLSPEGKKLAGNLESWPKGILPDASLKLLNISPAPEPQSIFAKATLLSDGYRILVGRDAGAYHILQRRLFNNLLIGFGLFLVTGLGVGLLTARAFLRRINRLNQLCQDVENGDLSARVPLWKRRDEIDTLGRGLNGMLDRISALLTLHKQTADNIAHEIRSPLMRLNAIIEQGEKKKDITADSAELARRQIEDSVTLLDKLLDISRIEATEKDRSSFTDINFSQLLENIAELYAPLAEEKALNLSVIAEDNIHISGLEQNLSRLCANLIDNALKFARTKVTLTLKRNGDKFILSISDDGPGIDAHIQDRIFERFTKGNNEHQAGTGLGLALVKAIADQHKMAIDIASDSKGTTLTLTSYPL